MTSDTVDLVVLDVNETLSDMSPMDDVFARFGAPAGTARRWFAATLQTGFALSMAGTPRPFAEIATAVLPGVVHQLPLQVTLEDAAQAVFEGFTSLSLHDDVGDGLRELASAGLRVITLTNGAAANTRALLDRHGVLDLVELTLSVEDAPAWKPDRRAYQYGLARAQVEPARAVMVAVHPWDLHGAKQVGMSTAYLDRTAAPYPDLDCAPDLVATTLTGLAGMLR